MTNTVFQISSSSESGDFIGTTLRQFLPIVGTGNKIRVKFQAGSATGCTITNASIGIAAGPSPQTPNTIDVPIELLFSGVSGVTIGANSTATSDWTPLNIEGANSVIVIADFSDSVSSKTGRTDGAADGWKFQSSNSAAHPSYNIAAPDLAFSSYTNAAGTRLVSLIESETFQPSDGTAGFDSYAELQTSITNWLGGRSDLTSYYASWIALFECWVARKFRWKMQQSTAILTATTDGVLQLPKDFLAPVRLSFFTSTNSRSSNLQFLSPDIFHAYYPLAASLGSGVPQSYTVEAGKIFVRPIDYTSNAFTLVYYAKNRALADQLNWLFVTYPDIYLFGALTEAGGFVEDGNQLLTWKGRRDEIYQEILASDFKDRPASMAIRPLAFTP